MTDVELEAMEEQQRRRFCDELKAQPLEGTELNGETAISLIRKSMLAIGISPPEVDTTDLRRLAA